MLIRRRKPEFPVDISLNVGYLSEVNKTSVLEFFNRQNSRIRSVEKMVTGREWIQTNAGLRKVGRTTWVAIHKSLDWSTINSFRNHHLRFASHYVRAWIIVICHLSKLPTFKLIIIFLVIIFLPTSHLYLGPNIHCQRNQHHLCTLELRLIFSTNHLYKFFSS